MATLKDEVLKTALESSYKSQKTADKMLRQHGYNIDPKLSSMETKVFSNKKTGVPLVVQRGSKTLADWAIADTALALGLQKYTKRFQNAKKITQQVRDKYHNDPITVGHSLGGSLALESGTKNQVYAYNPGLGLNSIGTTIRKNTKIIRTPTDAVSGLSVTMKDPHKNYKEIKHQTDGFRHMIPIPLLSPVLAGISEVVSSHAVKNL